MYNIYENYIVVSIRIMSKAKRLVLSLTGRGDTESQAGTSSTRLVSANSNSPGHELDEIAVVSQCDTGRVSYGSLSLGQPNGPRYIPGESEYNCTFLNIYITYFMNN